MIATEPSHWGKRDFFMFFLFNFHPSINRCGLWFRWTHRTHSSLCKSVYIKANCATLRLRFTIFHKLGIKTAQKKLFVWFMNSKRQTKVKRSHIIQISVCRCSKQDSKNQTKTRDLRGAIESFNCLTYVVRRVRYTGDFPRAAKVLVFLFRLTYSWSNSFLRRKSKCWPC